ncbi:MAG: TonB-dependent receptor [Janthinobacterium lividum]
MILPGTATSAQTTPATPPSSATHPNDADTGDIIVTARKRDERLQDVPSTITAISGARLEDGGGRKLTDLTAATSGISFVSLGGAQPLVSVRGDSNRIGSSEVGTGVFIDGIYVSRASQLGTGPVDVARVEFLKGPQSTLYGKNTIAGAINILTNDPTWKLEASVEGGYGGSSQNGETLWHAQGIVSGPIVEDKLAVRIVVSREKRDGYLYDPATGQSGLGYDATYVRGKIWIKPAPDVDWKLSASYRKDNAPRWDTAVLRPGGAVVLGRPGLAPLPVYDSIWQAGTDITPYTRTHATSFTSDLKVATPIGDLTILTNYQYQDTTYLIDSDKTRYAVTTNQAGERSSTFSNEVRLAGSSNGISWLAGGYLFSERVPTNFSYAYYYQDSSNFLNGVGSQLTDSTNGKNETLAAFGQLGYDLTSRLNLSGGLRVARDSRESSLTTTVYSPAGLLTRTAIPTTFRQAAFDSLTGNAVATYKFTRDAMLYASYSTGNKAGGFGSAATPAAALVPFKEAKVKAYETGFKSYWPSLGVRLNVSGFYNDYSNLQLQQTLVIGTAVTTITTNAAKAKAYGADVDLTIGITPHLQATAAYTYLHARINEYLYAPGVVFGGFAPRAILRIQGWPD